VACCAIGWGEIVATLHRHLREKRLTQREFQLLAAQVQADVRAGLWSLLPVTSAIIEAQAERIRRLPDRVFVRAADALHLTCAVEAGLQEIYSSDRHLVAASPYFGLKAVTL
jgi:predicted nucleic acid-binding protein